MNWLAICVIFLKYTQLTRILHKNINSDIQVLFTFLINPDRKNLHLSSCVRHRKDLKVQTSLIGKLLVIIWQLLVIIGNYWGIWSIQFYQSSTNFHLSSCVRHRKDLKVQKSFLCANQQICQNKGGIGKYQGRGGWISHYLSISHHQSLPRSGILSPGSRSGNLSLGSGLWNLSLGSGSGNLFLGSGSGYISPGSKSGNVSLGSRSGNVSLGSRSGYISAG